MRDDYSILSVIVVVEVIKFVMSIAMIIKDTKPGQSRVRVFSNLTRSSLGMAVPGITYFVQKIFNFWGLHYLDPTVYAIITQLKLLTTAIFSVVLLRKTISVKKWRALMTLLTGVVIINVAARGTSQSESEDGNFFLGCCSALVVAVLSGFTGVWIEYSLKKGTLTIWESNYQLSLYGIIMAVISKYSFESVEEMSKGFFYGWNLRAIGVVLLYAVGGLMVAVIGKYANMILKGFATSFAIICTVIVSYWFFDGVLNITLAMGVIVVIISLFNYTEPALPPLSCSKCGPAESCAVDAV